MEPRQVKTIDQRIAALPPERLARLLARLDQAIPTAAAADRLPPLAPRPRAGAVRTLSFAQERLWFLGQLSPGGSDYNVAGAMRLRGAAARPAYEQALQEIMRRHEVLRASFRDAGGKPVQEVAAVPAWRPALA